MRLQGVEIQWHIGQARRQDAARSAARQVGIQRVAFEHAAAVLVDQLLDRDAGRRQLHTRLPDAAGDGKRAQALAPMAAM